jgi:alcohol dehydrogenase class IV
MGTTGYALHHVVCQTLVRVAGTPHAETNAVMLPHTVRFMAMRAPDAIESLRKAIGGDVADLAATAGATTLTELGAEPSAVDAVLEAAAGRRELHNTPGGAPPPDRLRAYVEAAL